MNFRADDLGSEDSLPGTDRVRANGLEPMDATDGQGEVIYCVQAPADIAVALQSCLHD